MNLYAYKNALLVFFSHSALLLSTISYLVSIYLMEVWYV